MQCSSSSSSLSRSASQQNRCALGRGQYGCRHGAQRWRQLAVRYYAHFRKPPQGSPDVVDLEPQRGAPEIRGQIKSEVDEIAGAGYVRHTIALLVHADEAEFLPVIFRRFGIAAGDRDLQEITAARCFGVKPLARRESSRFDESYELTGWIEPAHLVEYVIAEMPEREFDPAPFQAVQVFEQVGPHESQRRRGN